MTNIDEAIDFLRESNNIEGVWSDDALAQSIFAWEYIIKKDKLTPGVVLRTHKILMLHRPLLPNEKGYFRRVPVSIGGRLGEPYLIIPQLITDWCVTINNYITGARDSTKDEKRIKAHHVTYENIHPFIDGNGRTGRIFMNWERVRLGLPILVIKEKEKYTYYNWFE
ncbi:MAG: Fic family protein [Sulfurovaceae bacterium]|nr:Fic family protein [Sulfurovaceae bacterium]